MYNVFASFNTGYTNITMYHRIWPYININRKLAFKNLISKIISFLFFSFLFFLFYRSGVWDPFYTIEEKRWQFRSNRQMFVCFELFKRDWIQHESKATDALYPIRYLSSLGVYKETQLCVRAKTFVRIPLVYPLYFYWTKHWQMKTNRTTQSSEKRIETAHPRKL